MYGQNPKRQSLGGPPTETPWSDIASLVTEIKDLIASNNALVAAISALTTGGIPVTPVPIATLNTNLQNLITAINNMPSGGGGLDSVGLAAVNNKLDTLIAIGSNVGKIQIYNLTVTDVAKELPVPSWAIPDGMFVGITNRFSNALISPTATVTIWTVEDSSNTKQLAPGAEVFYRVTNLSDLKVSGDTVGMIIELDVEKK